MILEILEELLSQLIRHGESEADNLFFTVRFPLHGLNKAVVIIGSFWELHGAFPTGEPGEGNPEHLRQHLHGCAAGEPIFEPMRNRRLRDAKFGSELHLINATIFHGLF